MSTEAKYIKEIKVNDPDTGGVVHLALYKHMNGGMFAMDSSFIDQVPDEDEGYDPDNEMAYITGITDRCVINDPFAPVGEPEDLLLTEE